MNNKKRFHVEFHPRDFLQVVIGAGILAIPVGFTQEVWDLAEALPFLNVLGFLIVSVLFIAMFTLYHYHRKHLAKNFDHFIERVFFTYIVAFLVVAVLLALIGKTPWITDTALAFKRVTLVTFPASMSGAIADTLK
ncbi:DUF2391 family protein [Candidatus Woesearchaeota archaeon]|nr:DUF2391 family protein [Candidatus Woesearchaeota archaeon]